MAALETTARSSLIDFIKFIIWFLRPQVIVFGLYLRLKSRQKHSKLYLTGLTKFTYQENLFYSYCSSIRTPKDDNGELKTSRQNVSRYYRYVDYQSIYTYKPSQISRTSQQYVMVFFMPLTFVFFFRKRPEILFIFGCYHTSGRVSG